MLKILFSGKHSSLLCHITKGFNKSEWSQSYKTFYARNLRMYVKSWRICSWQAFPPLSNVCGYGQEPTLEWSTSGRRETMKRNKGNGDGVKSHDSVFLLCRKFSFLLRKVREKISLCSVENSHFSEKGSEKKYSMLCRKFSFT
jgi:hypothetical protein